VHLKTHGFYAVDDNRANAATFRVGRETSHYWVVGGVVFLALLFFAIMIHRRRRNRRA
jgi:hypothetical protein